MRVSICFSWPAWTGVNTSWLLLWGLLSSKWYHVLWDKEYASIIKWDNNDFILYISDESSFISRQIDYFFAQDDYAVSKNEKIYDLKNIHNLKSCDCKYKNTFSFWASLKVLWISLDEWKKLINQNFENKDSLNQNLIDLEKWYNYISKSDFDLSKNIWNSKEFKFWNQIIGEWAIASWLEWYSAYPMTPASSLIDVIVPYCHSEWNEESSKNLDSSLRSEWQKIVFFQWEDEIAVAMSMLGAKFAGKRAMCGTSGGWFALMVESISFSNQTEIWWVYVLSQRDWPSTWTPTFTSQWDLKFSLTPTFWETAPIVIAPSSYKDWYNLIWKALNRSDMYQHPVIVLLDKQYSESYMSIDPAKFKAEAINRWELVKWQEWYKRYAFTDSWISPYTIPGTENGEFIASSYEHDEYWATNEEPEMKKQMMEKRFKKMETFIQKEFNPEFYWYEIINPEATNFYITFGFNSYVLKDYIKDKKDYGLIIIKVMQPFDMRLKTWLEDNKKNIKNLTFVEMNYTWQLQELVTNLCLLNTPDRSKKIKNIRKYDLYPIFEEDINL
jgi:2-oxoglutarate ferredoxin oxidoreductase subunit alpha